MVAGSASPVACPKVANNDRSTEVFSQRACLQAKLRKIAAGPHEPKVCPRENLGPQGQRRIHGATAGSPTRRSRCRADVDSGGEHGRVAPLPTAKQLCPCSRTSANASGSLSSTFAVCTWPCAKARAARVALRRRNSDRWPALIAIVFGVMNEIIFSGKCT